MKERWCTVCKEVKPKESFPTGIAKFICKQCIGDPNKSKPVEVPKCIKCHSFLTTKGKKGMCQSCQKELKKLKAKANILVKVCNSCEIEKPSCEFHLNVYTRDGLHNECRQCRSETYLQRKRNRLNKS